MNTLLAYFARRPLLVNLCMVFAFILGLASLKTSVFSAYPDFDLGVFNIMTQAPGRSPEDVELGITAPLEDELLKIDGVKELRSKSVEGYSAIVVSARDDADASEISELADDLQRAIDRAAGRLPEDLPNKPRIVELGPDRQPVIELLVVGEVDETLLREVAEKVQDELREVIGVAGTDRRGYRGREVRILIDPLAMHRLGVTYDEIEQAIAARNITQTGGALESFVTEQDVVAVGRFRDAKEVEDVIIRANEYGNFVRLRDLAEVVYGYEEWSVRSYVDGVPGIYLGVRRNADANEIAVVDRVQVLVDDLNSRLPPGVDVVVINELSRLTEAMLATLAQNGVAGVLLVFAVLLLFFPWRSAFWVVAGMPVAVLLGFALMPVFGLTVNQFTLAAIILMLGLLVDDAVVTSESIFRHYDDGQTPLGAAVAGTKAVAPAVITGALTTLLAFTPLVFLGGKEGKFMWMLPAMVMLIVIASLLECKLLLPAHMAHSLQRSKASREARWFQPIERGYRLALAYLLKRRYRSLLLLTLAFAAVVMAGLRVINVDMYPETDVDVVHVRAQLPAGSSFDNTLAQMRKVERLIHELIADGDLRNTRLTVGTHDVGRPEEVHPGSQSSRGMIDIFLETEGVRTINSLDLVRTLRRELARFDQFDTISVFPKPIGPPVGFPVELQVIGNGAERETVATELLAWLDRQPGVVETWSSYEQGKGTVSLQLRHEAIASYGLSVAEVTRAIRVAFDGYIIEQLQTLGERIDYRLQFQEPYRGNADTLRSLTLINSDGGQVPLRALVDYEVGRGQAAISHYFGKRVETVFAEIERSATSVAAVNANMQGFIEAQAFESRYPGLRIRYGGELASQQATINNMSAALLVILLAMFFVMVLLFDSLTQPLIVLIQVPLGFAGVLIAFIIHGYDLSLPAIMGALGLAGVLVNSAIVLIDRLNQYRVDGLVAEGDMVTGAAYRLRPILITSLTTTVGLAPAAYGLMGSNPFLTPMIMAMLWGIAFGTLVTLFYVPCLYTVEQDLRRRLRQWRGVIGRGNDQHGNEMMDAGNDGVAIVAEQGGGVPDSDAQHTCRSAPRS